MKCKTKVCTHDACTVLFFKCSNWVWFWLSLLSLLLYTKFSNLCINLLRYQYWVKYSFKTTFVHTKKKCTYNQVQGIRTFINQLAKLLYEVLWGLTPIGHVKWWCSTSICWFHIRSFPFYGTNTKLSQLSIFYSIIKCYDNIFFLYGGVEFQCKVNNDTSTPRDRH